MPRTEETLKDIETMMRIASQALIDEFASRGFTYKSKAFPPALFLIDVFLFDLEISLSLEPTIDHKNIKIGYEIIRDCDKAVLISSSYTGLHMHHGSAMFTTINFCERNSFQSWVNEFIHMIAFLFEKEAHARLNLATKLRKIHEQHVINDKT